MITSIMWLMGVSLTALVIDYHKEMSCEKLTNLDCFVVLVAWPYVLVRELVK